MICRPDCFRSVITDVIELEQMSENPYKSPTPKAVEPVATHEMSSAAVIRSMVFFMLFFTTCFVFGGWMMFHFGFGSGKGHHLRTVGLILGTLCTVGSGFPFYTAVMIYLKLFRKPQ